MTHPPIGIDLGTTNSLIAVFDDGAPRLLANALGGVLTPSVVSVTADGILVGEAARERLATHPKDTAAAFKRRMGTEAEIRLGRRGFRAEELSSLVLRKLKEDAESALGCSIRDVVVSVPAYFNQTQRQATKTACTLAGLTVLRLINEPTAAALAYGLQDRDGESQFLVFDLGGGTFDVTVLEHFDGVMEVKASSGDAFLGGEDFTEALARAMAEKLDAPWAGMAPEDQAQLRLRAESAKRHLTSGNPQDVALRLRGAETRVTLTAAEFETAAKPLLKRLMRPIERCLFDGRGRQVELDRVILVGGATRMPMIRQLVARQFRMLPEMTIDPDHAVALGAAVQAGLIAEDRALDDVVMTDVSPFSVGISTTMITDRGAHIPGFFEPIIERNTPLPASREKYFSTLTENQTQLSVQVYQGEAAKVTDNIPLGTFAVDVPKGKAGAEGMAVRITCDPSGLIEVEGRALSTGKVASIVIRENATGLDEAEINSRLAAMKTLKLHPREDEENTALLARLGRIYEMAMGDDRAAIRTMMASFEAALARQDLAEIAEMRGEMGKSLDRIDDFYGG